MKTIIANIHIGGGNWRAQKIDVYTKEEAKKILATKDWEVSDDAYIDNQRVAVGFEYVENNTVCGLYMEV